MKLKSIFFIFALLTAAFLGGCNTNQPNPPLETNKDIETLKIFTTIFPIEDFTKKIGGKHVEVKSVYPAGADAHTFEPTMRLMMEIADADLFIYNGAGLESFIDKTKKTLSKEKVTMVEASKGIELLSGEGDHHDHGNDESGHEHGHDEDHSSEDPDGHHHHDKDPHIWLDPIYASKMAENIKDALVGSMPSAKEEFEKNYADLKLKLEQLDVNLKETIEASDRKEILVSHASYGYWEHRYGIKQISISGLSPENEPSQKQLQTIIETAREHNISYIIYDQNPLTKVAVAVQKETGTKAITLHNLEYITENDLKNQEDYFSIMNKNIEGLKTALSN
ncbi:metal ABC transporter substrate-binding protein [Lederbergia citrea]|uniref:Zinc ABC transporter substrate-binding protein n=1 Tax=Lederbergia citrea TaxID=2833581 RepID=A0A942Z6U9_9BACI|nr:metal ABC transporter substrate-binding protein [Lederbergia citrea]MBS4205899.1 zinc ABC transporter substrate-binding protein [Lederbergia citrea]MBS4224652.1 zinc ABC transporter substrate-binding protein [Lederbergia citrea]